MAKGQKHTTTKMKRQIVHQVDAYADEHDVSIGEASKRCGITPANYYYFSRTLGKITKEKQAVFEMGKNEVEQVQAEEVVQDDGAVRVLVFEGTPANVAAAIRSVFYPE